MKTFDFLTGIVQASEKVYSKLGFTDSSPVSLEFLSTGNLVLRHCPLAANELRTLLSCSDFEFISSWDEDSLYISISYQ